MLKEKFFDTEKQNAKPMPKNIQGIIKRGLRPLQLRDINAEANPTGPNHELRPWDKQAGEPIEWYEKFLYYKNLGPDRAMPKACSRYLVTQGDLLPGQPVPSHILHLWYKISLEWQWLLRARYWDRENVKEVQEAFERERQLRIKQMVEEHMAGWEAFQSAAIRSIYQKDEEGNLLRDEQGQPKLKEIEDVGTAARVFKQATQGKRVEMGLPNDLLVLQGPELARRFRELQTELNSLDDDVIEGEFTEDSTT